MPDVILTGLPRSGLTVAGALIDTLPDSVCLNAPAWQTAQAKQMEPLPFAKWLVGDFTWQRARLLRREPIRDMRADDGSPLLDGMNDARAPGKPVLFTRPGLTENFILAMKHHALYTALLPQLAAFGHFTVIAVIRHPLDVIASWWRLAAGKAAAGGKLPASATRFWPEAERISHSDLPPIERMAQLYEAHLERYHELRDQIHIVKFEEMIDDPALIGRILGVKKIPAAARRIERRKRIRIAEETEDIRRLLRRAVFTRQYYGEI